MDKYITELIALDKQSNRKSLNDEHSKQDFYDTVTKMKKEVYDKMWADAKLEVEQEISRLEQVISEDGLNNQKESEQKKQDLNKKFSENKDLWVQTILKRVLD